MSAPDTNTKKQTKRHWAPLLGFLLVVCFGVGIILYWVGEEVATAPEDESPATESPSVTEAQDGDVNVPDSAPVEEVEPIDPPANPDN